jgi:hypothetical protein
MSESRALWQGEEGRSPVRVVEQLAALMLCGGG